MMNSAVSNTEIYPLTPERLDDLEALFGPRGAVGGCWCMYWRLQHAEYEQLKGAGNHNLMQNLVKSGETTGLLAYQNGEVVGWISLGPREDFPRLGTSRILARIDDQPVWSVVCFYIDRKMRRTGLSMQLLSAAIEFARTQKAEILEAYPVEPKNEKMPSVFAYTGVASTFQQLGFVEVARRSESRPIMRLTLT